MFALGVRTAHRNQTAKASVSGLPPGVSNTRWINQPTAKGSITAASSAHTRAPILTNDLEYVASAELQPLKGHNKTQPTGLQVTPMLPSNPFTALRKLHESVRRRQDPALVNDILRSLPHQAEDLRKEGHRQDLANAERKAMIEIILANNPAEGPAALMSKNWKKVWELVKDDPDLLSVMPSPTLDQIRDLMSGRVTDLLRLTNPTLDKLYAEAQAAEAQAAAAPDPEDDDEEPAPAPEDPEEVKEPAPDQYPKSHEFAQSLSKKTLKKVRADDIKDIAQILAKAADAKPPDPKNTKAKNLEWIYYTFPEFKETLLRFQAGNIDEKALLSELDPQKIQPAIVRPPPQIGLGKKSGSMYAPTLYSGMFAGR